MASAVRTKTADKQALLKKLHPVVKKLHKLPSSPEFPVLETMLYAVCLEDSPIEEAQAAYEQLRAAFTDLNEARVSSVTELQEALGSLHNSEWKAYRYKGVLQHVFDKNYTFEFEGLKKRTLELAQKQLVKIKSATPFVRTYTLHAVLGAHVIPLDESSIHTLVWLGLAMPGQNADEISESLKTTVKKAEVDSFCGMIRALATDSNLRSAFNKEVYPHPPEGFDAGTAMERLAELMKLGPATYWEKLKKQTEPKGKGGSKSPKSEEKTTEVAAETSGKTRKPKADKPSDDKLVAKKVSKPAKESTEKGATSKAVSSTAKKTEKTEKAEKAPSTKAASKAAPDKKSAKAAPSAKTAKGDAKTISAKSKAAPVKKTGKSKS